MVHVDTTATNPKRPSTNFTLSRRLLPWKSPLGIRCHGCYDCPSRAERHSPIHRLETGGVGCGTGRYTFQETKETGKQVERMSCLTYGVLIKKIPGYPYSKET